MSRSRGQLLAVLIVAGVGLVIAFVVGLFAYMSATATPLHPDPHGIRTTSHAEPSPDWSRAVERGRQIVRAGLVEQNLPGLSVAVGAGGEVVWAEGFGWADLESRVPVAPDTRFRIGTASIALTSAAAGLLLEEGRLKLDEEIQNDVPEFPKKDWPVTLRQVMAHVAGLRNDGGDEGPLFGQNCDRSVEALRQFADGPLLFEPGTRYRFSSYGWILVSAAIEAAADEPLFRFMRKRIFEPLGMQDTRPDAVDQPIADRATPYFPRFGADPRYGLHLMRPVNFSCYAGASALLSTPSDLVRFAMAINGGTLLQPATVHLLQAPQRLASGEETGYGLGWDLETVSVAGAPTRWVGHDGTVLGGPVAALVTLPERGLAVAVVSNISYAGAEALAVSVAQAFVEDGRPTSGR